MVPRHPDRGQSAGRARLRGQDGVRGAAGARLSREHGQSGRLHTRRVRQPDRRRSALHAHRAVRPAPLQVSLVLVGHALPPPLHLRQVRQLVCRDQAAHTGRAAPGRQPEERRRRDPAAHHGVLAAESHRRRRRARHRARGDALVCRARVLHSLLHSAEEEAAARQRPRRQGRQVAGHVGRVVHCHRSTPKRCRCSSSEWQTGAEWPRHGNTRGANKRTQQAAATATDADADAAAAAGYSEQSVDRPARTGLVHVVAASAGLHHHLQVAQLQHPGRSARHLRRRLTPSTPTASCAARRCCYHFAI